MDNKVSISLISIFILIFSVFGCKDERKNIEENLSSMQLHPISLNLDKMVRMHSKNDTSYITMKAASPKYRYIVYVDSSECSPCMIDHMYEWNGLIDSIRERNLSVDFIFIVAPRYNQKEDAILAIESSGLKNDIYVDTAYTFMQANTYIPKEAKYHAFIINDSNKVVLVGNVLNNKRINNMFNKILKIKAK